MSNAVSPDLEGIRGQLSQIQGMLAKLTSPFGTKLTYGVKDVVALLSPPYNQDFVRQELQQGKFPGAYQDGGKNTWVIPHESLMGWLEYRKRVNSV